MRLLLLEDDRILGDGLRAFLASEGHVVDWFERLLEARVVERDPWDLLLVDWQLPDGSGIDWLRSLRQRGIATPAIVLTARDTLKDRITGLDSGADDYMVKPFDPEELAARIRAVARRHAGSAGTALEFGPVRLDLGAHQAWLEGVEAGLTAREWQLVEALVLRAGRWVPKADLEQLVLGLDGELASNALEVHVSSVRRKLGRGFIETARGLGYRVPA